MRYILNLHGSDKDAKEDENVFDIKTGVSISIFIKHATPLPEKKYDIFLQVITIFLKELKSSSFFKKIFQK